MALIVPKISSNKSLTQERVAKIFIYLLNLVKNYFSN
jgi:hypothetical protein